jgi:hypothetical protein
MKKYNYKVEQENGSYDKFEFYIMLLNFADEIVENVLVDLSIFKLNKKSRKKGYTDIYIYDLNDNININLIISIIDKYKLTEEDYGLYIDITSNYSDNLLHCPIGIAEIYQKLGGIIFISNGTE